MALRSAKWRNDSRDAIF